MPLLIDTNLLVLYVAGRTDLRIVGTHKRLVGYSVSDYRKLADVIARHGELVITPNTMTEAANLLSQIADPFRTNLRRGLKSVAASASEIAVPSHTATLHPDYEWLGLTDAVILTTLQDAVVALTMDLDLYRAAIGRGLRAINFAHLRDT